MSTIEGGTEAPTDSYLRNCLLVPQGEDTMFSLMEDGIIRARLDGYAIIPMVQYEALTKRRWWQVWK